ncbi:MAG: hypothetical protein US35_C0012G0011 [Parcubacteria group bacterium GW2011_GWA2_37_10]|nr:MAG: hypothetical protein US35_C0012G0011 [Parcubacteria group bacterium GW2011_GWA2_37_10]
MLAEIKNFVKGLYDRNFYDIMIFIVVALLIFFSFAAGFIIAKYQDKESIQIENS